MATDEIKALEERLKTASDDAISRLGAVTNIDDLRSLQNEVLGKKGSVGSMKSELGRLNSVDAKKEAGAMLNTVTEQLEAAFNARRELLEDVAFAQQVATERLDLTEHLSVARRGHSHLVTQATRRLEDVFTGLGFQIAEGPEVETDFYNFEALNMPKSHPARSMWDTMFVESGEPGSVLLRTHTSPVQIRVMESWKPPIYAIMPGRVFRRDTPDATHMPVFHQIECLVIDRGITFADLAGTIESFTKAFFGGDFTSRLRPSYFPFTEPSAEFDIRRPDGTWIELGGCGMVHPNVLRAGGLDPEEWTGFAFGFGIDRMAKERHGIDDIREMYTNDLRFLRQF
jgi:phenylalanyl-tRNA synthetase alpha chain